MADRRGVHTGTTDLNHNAACLYRPPYVTCVVGCRMPDSLPPPPPLPLQLPLPHILFPNPVPSCALTLSLSRSLSLAYSLALLPPFTLVPSPFRLLTPFPPPFHSPILPFSLPFSRDCIARAECSGDARTRTRSGACAYAYTHTAASTETRVC
eukprot:3796853-Rhodomonas_salina.3